MAHLDLRGLLDLLATGELLAGLVHALGDLGVDHWLEELGGIEHLLALADNLRRADSARLVDGCKEATMVNA
jgi:hypothetical protein